MYFELISGILTYSQ